MTNDIDLSIREIDDLLQHLYLKVKGKKEGLSLVEPAAILLARLKSANPSFYAPQLARFTPIIMDALISEAYVSFGYEGLESITDVAGDIALATGDYIPVGVEEGLSRIRGEIDSISAILNGDSTEAETSADAFGKSETGTGGFFRERAWGTAGLPLVSTYNTGRTPFSTGRVVKARVEIRITGEWSVRTRRDPVINFEHISSEPNSPFERQIHTAVRVAEEFAAARMGIKGIFRVPREYRISLPEIASFPASAIQRLSGGSAGLAIAALLVSVLGRLDLYRYRLRINPAIAFTGKVDETGNTLAVEDSHISDKVQAVFFSRFSKLILPAGNLDTAERELAVLSRKHPARKLDLVPASNIAGIFGDSEVTTRRMSPAGKPVLQRLFFWRKHLLTAASLAALIIISLFIGRPYYRRDIAKIAVKGNMIAITNKFGRTITEHELEFDSYKEGGMKAYVRSIINDFDGNGENEAVCILSESRHLKSSSPYNRLHFIIFDNKGRFRFKYLYDNEKLLGDEIDPNGRSFAIATTHHTTVFRDDRGVSKLLALAHHLSRNPGSVISLSLEDFSSQVFVHQGFLFQMALKDIDLDGILDIVLSGYNDMLKSCVVVVLDPRYMHGSSPEGSDYDVPGFEEDIAKYYLRLPDFYRYAHYPKNDYFPFTAKIKNSPEELIVSIRTRGDNTRFFLVDSMKCIGAEVIAGFYNKAVSASGSTVAYDYPEKKQDEEMLRTGVRYWDGEEWVPEPTVNRSYLRHVKAHNDTLAGKGE